MSVEDIAGVYIPRLDSRIENKLADLLEEAARQRDEADFLERSLAAEAEELIERFLGGDTNNFTAAKTDKGRAYS